MNTELTEAQLLVHQKIGRNLLRIQHLERMLKFLTAINGFEAPVNSFQKEFATRLKKVERMPMGQLVETVAKAVFTAAHTQAMGSTNTQQVTIRFAFGLEDAGHLLKEWRKQHREVVRERNRLVHRFIYDCDLRTIEGCEASAMILDQQRERMISASQSIESMVNAVRESFEDIQSGKAVLSPDRELAERLPR